MAPSLFELLFFSHDAILVRDLEDRLQFWNRGAEKLYGWRFAEVANHLTHRLLETRLSGSLAAVREQCLQEGSWEGELVHRCKDGRTVIVESRWVLQHENGEPRAILEINRDITARRTAEESLKKKEQQLRLLTDAVPVVIAHIGRDMRYRFVNRAYAERFGEEPEFFIGKTIVEAHGEKLFAGVQEQIARVLAGEAFEIDLDVDYPRTGLRKVRVAWRPEVDSSGEIGGWISALTDITDLALLEKALSENEERLTVAQKAARSGVFEYDYGCGRIYWSPEHCALYGLKPGEFDGRPAGWQNRVHPEDRGEIDRAHKLALQTGQFAADFRCLWPDGSSHWLFSRGQIFYDVEQRPQRMLGLTMDIEARKRVEVELETLRFTVANSLEFIGICDLKGRPFFVNAAALQMVGLDSLEAAQNQLVTDFFFPEDRRFILEEFLPQVLRNGHGCVEIRFRNFKSGEPIWMNYNVITLKEHGQPTGFATISQNISAWKLAEEKLRASEDRNRTIVESLPQLVWTCNADGRCDYLSPQWVKFTGAPAEEQTGSGWLRHIHPSDVPTVEAAWNHSIRTGSDYQIEFRIRNAQGEYRWFATRAVPLRNQAGQIIKWFGTNTDITERRNQEAELHISRERLEAALFASCTGTFRWDIQTNELEWDDQLDQLFGLGPGAGARSLSQFIAMVHPEDRDRVISACQRCAREGTDFQEEFRLVWPDGSIHWLEDKGKTFSDSSGRPTYMTGACVDITARKKIELELVDARIHLEQYAANLQLKVSERTASLEAAVAQMEEFSYSVSHDLRAPIRAVHGYAKLLLEEFPDALPPEALKYVQRIIRSSSRMDQLTLDVLTLTQISRGPVALSAIPLDMLLADILAEMDDLKPPRAEVEIVAPLGTVLGHQSLLTQALANLLGNAAKFVPPGRTPHIRVSTERSAERTRLLIQDNGIGIAPQYQSRLFGIFERVHPDGKYEGTGIGLAIVRKAVERMGGRAGVISDGQSGSTFWIELQNVL